MTWHRNPRTTQERRANCGDGKLWCRGKRNWKLLVDAWDDLNKARRARSDKHKRHR